MLENVTFSTEKQNKFESTESIALFNESNRLHFSTNREPKLTHYTFRYPAKFHIPVARALIHRYTNRSDICLDPFNGSGTLVVEALASKRYAIGLDVDPLAVFVSRVKSTRISPDILEESTKVFLSYIQKELSQDALLRNRLMDDINESEYMDRLASEKLCVPPIPNIEHWFRKSVIIQLARVKSIILSLKFHSDIQNFFLLCFASIIRKCSNADPTPVSGLEVTSYMRKRESEGRIIDVEKSLMAVTKKCLEGVREFYNATDSSAHAINDLHDARKLAKSNYQADAVITSPPYQSAVDYYRRHQLEMFWLNLVNSPLERQRLIPNYLGRAGVAQKYMPKNSHSIGSLGESWIRKIEEISERRAKDFLHYYHGMNDFFSGVSTILQSGSPLVMVVGNNKIFGREFDTVSLFSELSKAYFEIEEIFWYPIKDRYMSYERRNGANINQEYVIVLKRR